MTDTTVTVAPVVPVSPKSPKKKLASSKSKSAAATHPSTSIMVTAAIKQLQDKKGTTLQAIKKYMAANYQVDSTKSAPFIRKFLKAAVLKGLLVQTKGSGASGHFKLVEVKKPVKVVAKKPLAKKSTTVKAPGASKKRKSTSKKPKSSEPAAKKVKKAAVVTKPKVAKKSPAKSKKAPATKTKPPKAKKTPVKKTAAPKKK